MADTLDELLEKTKPSLDDLLAATEPKAEPGLMQRAREMGSEVVHAPDKLLSQLPPYRAIKSTFAPALEGFNTQLANTMGLPVEMVNEALGYAKKDFLENPGNAMDSVRKAFKVFGVKTYAREAETMMEKIGEEGFRQFLFFGALRAAAPTMAAPSRTGPLAPGVVGEPIMQPGFQPGPGPTTAVSGSVTKEMGTQLARGVIDKPVTFAAGTAGASVGIPSGRYLGEEGASWAAPMIADSPEIQESIVKAGQTLGEFKGGMVGGVAATFAASKMRVIPRSERPQITPRSEPVIDPAADPEIARARAGEMLQSTLTAMDREIVAAIERVAARQAHGVSAPALGKELQQRISTVKDQARAIQKEAYNRIPQQQRIFPEETANAVEAMMNDKGAVPDSVPMSYLKGLQTLLGMEAFESGNLHVNEPTFAQLNQYRRAIQDARWGTRGSPVTGSPPNQALAEKLQVLEDAIFKDMENSLGDHVDGWRYASNLTIQLNDRFTRGPIGSLLGLDRQSTERIRPEDAAAYLLKTPGGMPSVIEAGKHLPSGDKASYIDPNTGRRIVGAQPEGTRDMMTAADQAIRAEFVAAANEAAATQFGHPDKAAEAAARGGNAWFQKVNKDIERFTRVYSDIDGAVSQGAKIMTQKREWENGVFAQYHKRETPDAAVKNLLAQPKPAEDTRRLIAGMKLKDGSRDEDAVKGLGRAMVENLILNSTSPEVALAKLANTRVRPAYEAAWGEDGLARVERILVAAQNAAMQDMEISRGPVRSILGIVSGVLANWSGHAAAAAAAPGSASANLRYPALFAKKANAILENIYQVANPMHLMSAAVYSPEAEAILMTRLPQNVTESYQFLKKLRAYSTLQEMTYNRSMKGYMDRYKKEQEEGPSVPFSTQ